MMNSTSLLKSIQRLNKPVTFSAQKYQWSFIMKYINGTIPIRLRGFMLQLPYYCQNNDFQFLKPNEETFDSVVYDVEPPNLIKQNTCETKN